MADNQQTTPPKLPREEVQVDSTPYNRGTATNAEFRQDETIDSIKNLVLKDISHNKTCGFEDMLRVMLRMVGKKTADGEVNELWAEETLQACLKVAVKFINSWNAPTGNNDEAIKLHKGLVAYCEANTEKDRYPGLVNALNAILSHFREDGNEDLPQALRKDAHDMESIYIINDPAVIKAGRIVGKGSVRKPDIVKLMYQVFNRMRGDEYLSDNWDAAYRSILKEERPEVTEEDQRLDWLSVLMSLELKKVTKLKANDVLVSHAQKGEPLAELDPLAIPISPDEDELPQLTSGLRLSSASGAGSSGQGGTESGRASRSRPQSQPSPTPNRKLRSGGTGSTPQATTFDRKRKADTNSPMPPAQKKAKGSNRTLHPTVQLALYATERLLSAPWITHTPGIILTDDKLHLWWYDREGTIQSKGLNFLKDLPHFVVMVLLFQRFSDEDFGVAPEFEAENPKQVKVTIEGTPYQFDRTQMRNHYEFAGRGTTGGTLDKPGSDGKVKIFLKMSWPEAKRDREAALIRSIVERAKMERDVDIIRHLPAVVGSTTFTKHSTSGIRALLGLPTEFSRVFVCTLFEELQPSTVLTGKEFWVAYWQIIKVHYKLWQWGFQHGDISVSNMMCRGKYGVLNDYDLCRRVQDNIPRNPGGDRTGTTPFMALDLLTVEAWHGKVKPLYRHDLESFMWVLVWISACYDENKEDVQAPFRAWLTGDFERCWMAKKALDTVKLQSTHSYRPILRGTRTLHDFWMQFYRARVDKALRELELEELSLTDSNVVLEGKFSEEESDPTKVLLNLINFVKNREVCQRAGLVDDLPQIVPDD